MHFLAPSHSFQVFLTFRYHFKPLPGKGNAVRYHPSTAWPATRDAQHHTTTQHDALRLNLLADATRSLNKNLQFIDETQL